MDITGASAIVTGGASGIGAAVERKVRQLDNDVESIYEILDELRSTTTRIAATQSRHGNRLDELAQHLEAHDQRFDGIDQRFDGIDQRFGGLDSKLDDVLALLRKR